MTQKVTFSAFFNTIQFVSKVLTGKTITNIMKHARRGSSKPHNPWVEEKNLLGPQELLAMLGIFFHLAIQQPKLITGVPKSFNCLVIYCNSVQTSL